MLCLNVSSDNEILKLEELSRNMNLLNWLCTCLVAILSALWEEVIRTTICHIGTRYAD